MKKTLMMVLLAFAAMTHANAQDVNQLRKQAAKDHNVAVKALDKEKSTKDAKKMMKQLQKEGWQTMASDKPMDMQIVDDRIMASEVVQNADGSTVNRWLMHTSMATQGSYNAAIAQARLACQTEIAAKIETRLFGALEQKISGEQESADKATTLDKFHQRFKAIVDGCLTNMKRGLTMYRRTANDNYEVQVTYAYDRKELAARLLKQAQQELEMQGDKDLKDVMDKIFDEME